LTVLTKNHFKNRQRLCVGLIICLLFLLLGACATTYDKMDKLNSTLRAYEKALRWAKFDMAYSFHKWDSNEQPSIPKHLKNIRLTNYSVNSRSFDEKTMTAKQTVTIGYYNQNNLRERSLDDKQQWEYFPDKKRWYLISKPPIFQ
ncbi:MAG: hypothetical protein KAU29_09515, partial [Gammaproteobacteria bacterium]|nr:hypothetical protein [Gammaproteobacteria bacterium]